MIDINTFMVLISTVINEYSHINSKNINLPMVMYVYRYYFMYHILMYVKPISLLFHILPVRF